MKIAGRRGYLISLESVAMTDIVLNMFIFFFICFSLLYTFSPHRLQMLKVKLPTAQGGRAAEGAPQAKVTLASDGAIYLDKDQVTMEELREKVRALRKAEPELAVMLCSDRSVRFQQVVSVLDLMTSLGVRNLDIAATGEKDAAAPRN